MLQAHATEPGSGDDERSRLRRFQQLTIELLLTTNTKQRLRLQLARSGLPTLHGGGSALAPIADTGQTDSL